MDLREDVALAPLTTLVIGGPARWFVEATSEDEVVEAVLWAREHGLPLFVLGGGSNLLVSDAGFDGLVLRVLQKGVGSRDEAGSRIYSAAAGENWDAFVERTVLEGCAGLECLAGIPGTVGGTPVQNVGAYGQEVSETIVAVRVLNLETLGFVEMSGAECRFSYRSSIFNGSARGQFLVTRVDYRMTPGGPSNLRYGDVQRAFAAGSQPSLAEVASVVRGIRRGKGMLLVDGDPDCRSAGSFFKNPVVSAAEFTALTTALGYEPPHYPAGDGFVKLPAAWLIDQAGFPKGFTLGRVGISSRHTLALVNLGGASAADLLALRDRIVDGVEGRFGVRLMMEPVLVGF